MLHTLPNVSWKTTKICDSDFPNNITVLKIEAFDSNTGELIDYDVEPIPFDTYMAEGFSEYMHFTLLEARVSERLSGRGCSDG